MKDNFCNPDHPVLQLIRSRRGEHSTPGHRSDDYKLGLAAEGGGIRGVVSAAMLCALEELGYDDVFDVVYGCSSGAINLAYFLNRRTWFPLTIYFDDLTSGEFLNYSRIIRGLAPMNVDFVFDEVLTKRKPLDYLRILDSPQPMHIIVSNIDELLPVDAFPFSDVDDLKSALRATIWLPVATKGSTNFRGYRAIDGGVIRFHPYRAAVADGCTHILSLSTRPVAPLKGAKLSLTNRFTAKRLEKMRPGLGTKFIAGVQEYQNIDRPLLNARRHDTMSSPSILDLAPFRHTPEVKRAEQDRRLLLDGAAAAYESVYKVFEDREVRAVIKFEVVEPSHQL